jgi:hypothetical protein
LPLGAQTRIKDENLWKPIDHHLLLLQQLPSLKTPSMVETIAEIDVVCVVPAGLPPVCGRKMRILMNSEVPSSLLERKLYDKIPSIPLRKDGAS